MKRFTLAAVSLVAAFAVTGCSNTRVTNHSEMGNERIARPAHIVVYDFAATPAEIAAVNPEAAQSGVAARQTPEEIAVGRKLGAQVASELVAEINAMGLSAVRASQASPAVGDIAIRGYFDSIDEGSTGKRVMLGFGSGAANLRTVVIAYQRTGRGMRRLGSGEVESGSRKTPGMIVPIAVVAATANPIGLVVGGAAKVAGEASGAATVEGAARRTANEIGVQLEKAFRRQGWID